MKGFWRRFCNRMKADALFAYLVTGVSICFAVGVLGIFYGFAIGALG
jgi:hypothetical protein